jgi:uncharacterized protein
MVAMKPTGLFDRDHEWERLGAFVASPLDGCLLGLVYGRRRQGKTTLLQHLCQVTDGFYWQADETEPAANLESLSTAWSSWSAAPGPIRFAAWEEAIEHLTRPKPRPTAMVLDEIGRVINKVPRLPSIIQRHLSPAGTTATNNWTRLVLCGSTFGQMRRLLDGAAPLRGRASLELVVQPFDYRTAAAFWGLEANPGAAFELYSYIGGTPAYRTLAAGELPNRGVERWVLRRLLDPSSALFREGRIVVAEDSELADQQLYWGLLSAIAVGKRRWSDLDEALGAKRGSLHHALRTVIDAGWVARRDDPLRQKRSVYELREPLVRFHRLVIEPAEHRLLAGADSRRVWLEAEPTVASLILGPQLEQLAADWAMLFAAHDTFGGSVTAAGPTSVGSMQIDLAAIERGARGAQRVLALGEVKAQQTRVGVTVVDRLDLACSELARSKVSSLQVTEPIKRVIVSRSGFTNDVRRLAERRDDIELVDLERLYTGS